MSQYIKALRSGLAARKHLTYVIPDILLYCSKHIKMTRPINLC